MRFQRENVLEKTYERKQYIAGTYKNEMQITNDAK